MTSRIRVMQNRINQEAQRRLVIRYVTAAVSAVTAVIYFLIGFHIVSVLENTNQSFGIAAGGAYVLGAVLLVAFDRRTLWLWGAVLQVMVIYTYFNLASARTPSFEVWGLLIRAAQFVILIGLVYLAVRQPHTEIDTRHRINT